MKLLIVDDHPIVVSACKKLFESDRDIAIFGAHSVSSARKAIIESGPDIVIVDLNLPDGSGLAFVRELIDDNPSLRAIVFSVNDNPRIAIQALRLGAKAFLCKLDETVDIKEAVYKVARGETWLPERLRSEWANYSETDREPYVALRRNEFETLRQLASGSNIHEVADNLGVSYGTAAKRCRGLRLKFKAKSLPGLVWIATQLNLI